MKYKTKQKHLLPLHIKNYIFKNLCTNNILLKMESNDELKQIDIKNCTCFYFDDITRIENIDFDDILSDKKS